MVEAHADQRAQSAHLLKNHMHQTSIYQMSAWFLARDLKLVVGIKQLGFADQFDITE
jgi:hypothetical protein